MYYKNDWIQAKERYEAFWNVSHMGRPAMAVFANRMEQEKSCLPVPAELVDRYTDMDYVFGNIEQWFENTVFAAEAIPNYFPNLGPGVLSCFVGSNPNFAKNTVWFDEIIENWESFHPAFDENGHWWI